MSDRDAKDYSPALLKTMCELMGWTSDHASKRLGANERTVKQWLTPGYKYPPTPQRLDPLLRAWEIFIKDLSSDLAALLAADPAQPALLRPYLSTGASATSAARVRALFLLLAVTDGKTALVEYKQPTD